MFADLFKFDQWDELDSTSWQYYDALWLKDFGPFKKDDLSSNIVFDLTEMKITEYSDDGKILRCIEIGFIVKG